MKPPTRNMLKVLRDIAAGLGPDRGCRTQSDYGGRHGTLMALMKRGLLTRDLQVSAEGKRLLKRML